MKNAAINTFSPSGAVIVTTVYGIVSIRLNISDGTLSPVYGVPQADRLGNYGTYIDLSAPLSTVAVGSWRRVTSIRRGWGKE